MEKPLVYFGAGRVGQYTAEQFSMYNIPITCYIDNDVKKQGGMLNEIEIYSYEEIKELYSEYDILLGDRYKKEKLEQLKRAGETNNIVDLGDILHPYDAMLYSFDYFKEHESIFCDSCEMLRDDISRETFVATIKHNITGNKRYLSEIEIFDNQYFPNDILRIENKEIFADCGAFRGDTIESFLQFCGGNYERIIAVEPDRENFNCLDQFVCSNNFTNIDTHCVALYREDTTLTFNECGSFGSQIIDEVGNAGKFTQVSAVSLDSLLNGCPVTFIKMDIEGAELAALEGARETIRKYKPKLAICVYHKPEDMLTIPQYIKWLVPEYKLYLRAHDCSSYDLVLYAVL